MRDYTLNPKMEIAIPAFTLQPQCITTLWLIHKVHVTFRVKGRVGLVASYMQR